MTSEYRRLGDLTAREFDAWHVLRSANPSLDSPYFDPGFARAVDSSGPPVFVCVREDRGEIRGLFAFHRDRHILRPVGWPGADFQAPIEAEGSNIAPLELLRSRRDAVVFDHLLGSCTEFDPWIERRRSSPYIDVTGGLDGYLGRASQAGKSNLAQARRRTAKAEREVGPIRFVSDSTDPELLERVVELKRRQYAATGSKDYFAPTHRRSLVGNLLNLRGSEFAGMLSGVYAGDKLLAAHFGLRSHNVLHWWFPVYDPGFGHLAPGWILLRELIVAAPALGITRIDLGRGDDEYKRRAKTGESIVCEAYVTRNPLRRSARRAKRASMAAVQASPAGPLARRFVHTVRGRMTESRL